MSSKRIYKVLILCLILVFYGSFLVHRITLPSDDLGRHIKNGEMILQGRFDVLYSNFYSYTEPNFPFVNHHWLSGVLFYLITKTVGFGGLVIFKASVLLTAFTILFLATKKKTNFWLVALLSIPTVLILKERTDVRPEIFSFLFIAIYIYILADLENAGRKKIFWLILLQIIWVNLHIYFFIGPALVGGLLLEKIFQGGWRFRNRPLINKLVVLFGALLIASFVNPSNIRGAVLPFKDFLSYTSYNVAENQSLLQFIKTNPPWDMSVRIFIPAVLLFAASFCFSFRRKPIFYGLAGLGSIAAGLLHVRGLPLFGLIFLPIVSYNMRDAYEKFKGQLERYGVLQIILAGLLVWLIFFADARMITRNREGGIGLAHESDNAADFLKTNDIHGPIFNNFDVGSYLIYNFYPREKVFVDNRAEAYSAAFFKDIYEPTLTNEQKWQETDDKYDFNALFLGNRDASPEAGVFMRRRLGDPKWRLVYADTYALILLRNNRENRNIIKKFEINRENIADKIDYLVKSSKQDDVMSAGNLFYLIGRTDLAMTTFRHLVAEWSNNSRIWFVMGAINSGQNDMPSLNASIAFLEKAVALGEKTAEVYTFLGLAYFKSGQLEKAEQIFQKSLKIDPSRKDTNDYLSQLRKYLNIKKP